MLKTRQTTLGAKVGEKHVLNSAATQTKADGHTTALPLSLARSLACLPVGRGHEQTWGGGGTWGHSLDMGRQFGRLHGCRK